MSEFSEESCIECGCVFGLPHGLRASRLRDGKRFYCPNGHAQIFTRGKAGVCPCCNRTFTQLARHMATQHPQFTPDAPEPPVLAIVGGKDAS